MSSIDRPDCRVCGQRALLRRNQTANGALQVGWYCTFCQRWAVEGKPFVTKWQAEQITAQVGKSLDDVPYIGGLSDLPACIICGHPQTELHHFAPQEYRDLFENWAEWPTAYLCPKHHSQWHELVQGRKIR